MLDFDDVGETTKGESEYTIGLNRLSDFEKYAFKEYTSHYGVEPDALDLTAWIKDVGIECVIFWLDDRHYEMTETLRHLIDEDRI